MQAPVCCDVLNSVRVPVTLATSGNAEGSRHFIRVIVKSFVGDMPACEFVCERACVAAGLQLLSWLAFRICTDMPGYRHGAVPQAGPKL